jgi:hypothetical protein
MADAQLIETRIEERDGATWVTGLCPLCWERCALVAPALGTPATGHCPNGHEVEINSRRSAGEHAVTSSALR